MSSKIDQIKVGQEAILRKSFSEADVKAFAELTGDTNPIHIDEEYASKSFFKKRIVHGLLYSSLISTILGTRLPGPGSIYLKQEINFKKPVFLNEVITVVVKVTEVNYQKALVHLSTCCYKGDSELVLEGNAIIKLI